MFVPTNQLRIARSPRHTRSVGTNRVVAGAFLRESSHEVSNAVNASSNQRAKATAYASCRRPATVQASQPDRLLLQPESTSEFGDARLDADFGRATESGWAAQVRSELQDESSPAIASPSGVRRA